MTLYLWLQYILCSFTIDFKKTSVCLWLVCATCLSMNRVKYQVDQCFLNLLVALIHSVKEFRTTFTNFPHSLISIFSVAIWVVSTIWKSYGQFLASNMSKHWYLPHVFLSSWTRDKSILRLQPQLMIFVMRSHPWKFSEMCAFNKILKFS